MSTIGAYTGTIKWFNATKGYGFIGRDGNNNPNGDGRDCFLHAGECRKSGIDTATLQEGDEVRFDLETTQRGDKAVNISRI